MYRLAWYAGLKAEYENPEGRTGRDEPEFEEETMIPMVTLGA